MPSAQSQLRGVAEEQREINKIQMTKNDQGGGGRSGRGKGGGGDRLGGLCAKHTESEELISAAWGEMEALKSE